MAKNVKETNALRETYVNLTKEMFANNGEDVLQVASNRIAFPCVGSDGGEYFVTITVAIPTGSRDGEPYDGYGEAESYRLKVADKVAKANAKKAKGK